MGEPTLVKGHSSCPNKKEMTGSMSRLHPMGERIAKSRIPDQTMSRCSRAWDSIEQDDQDDAAERIEKYLNSASGYACE